MDENNIKPRKQPTFAELIARGIAIIMCSFIAAYFILEFHAPWGH